jgi:hypothetical protein
MERGGVVPSSSVAFRKALAVRSEIRRARVVQLAVTEPCSCDAVLARVAAFG